MAKVCHYLAGLQAAVRVLGAKTIMYLHLITNVLVVIIGLLCFLQAKCESLNWLDSSNMDGLLLIIEKLCF